MTINPTFIDVTPVGWQPAADSAINSSLKRAFRFGESGGLVRAVTDSERSRFDSADGLLATPDLLDAYHRHTDGLALQQLERERGRSFRLPRQLLDLAARSDAAFPVGAGGFPRDFEFIRAQILEEKRQRLTAMELFPVDTSVPLGARRHTARRALGSGEAQIYRGGNELPRARTTYAEESFGVLYVVCSVDVNFFDAATTDWAGLQQYQRDLRLAVRLVEERMNRIVWNGDVGSQVAGVLNYPGSAKMVISTAFTDASTPADIAEAMLDFVNTPMVESGGVFSPNALAVSPKIHAFIFSRQNSVASDLTIGAYVLLTLRAAGSGVTEITVAPELSGIGPSGEDGMVLYRDELDTVGHVLIQAPTTLPVWQSSPLDQTTVVFGATGGVVSYDTGNMLIGLVDVTP